MTRDETLEAIKVMQHYADGGEVESRALTEGPFSGPGSWESFWGPWTVDNSPIWGFCSKPRRQYRIRRAPREFALEIGHDGNPSYFKQVINGEYLEPRPTCPHTIRVREVMGE